MECGTRTIQATLRKQFNAKTQKTTNDRKDTTMESHLNIMKKYKRYNSMITADHQQQLPPI